MEMRKIRCVSCGKLLAETSGDVNIVCPRCGGMNKYNAKIQTIDYTPKKDRKDRATSSGVTFS